MMPNLSDLTAAPNLDRVNETLARLSVSKRLSWIAENSKNPTYTSSLAREGQFIIYNIAKEGLPIDIVTLQTGRLFPETLDLLNITEERYGITIRQIEPDTVAVENYIKAYGTNGFYESRDARLACCSVRKTHPLTNALKDADAWITGLTREQSEGRNSTPFAVWSETHKLIKFNPLADVKSSLIKEAIIAHDIPVNPLYDRGYTSIGCAPCTRATKPGEHPRAGRWWWENNESSECGIHSTAA